MIFNYFLVLSVLLLISGLVLDAGLLEMRKMSMQTAADAAAQEGMSQLARNDSAWASEAAAQATQNGYTNGTNGATVTISNPATSTSYAGDTRSVQATISQSFHNLFMGLVNGGSSTVAATAVAEILPTCVWIMNNAGSTSYSSLALASATMHPACGVYVNTQAPGLNLGVDGFGRLLSTRIRVAGPASDNSSSGQVFPTPRFGAAVKNDPLAYVTTPVFSSCGTTNYSAGSGTFTLNPGTYCGGITMNGSTVTFNPGLYIVTGGLNWQNGQAYGSGVTFYLTQGGGSNFGTLSWSKMSVSMSAPTSSSGGGITGIFLFADRAWIAHGTQNLVIRNSTVVTDGLWYSLNTGMNSTSNTFTGTNYMGFVIDCYYQYLGNVNPSANYAPLGNISPLHYEDGALVQ